MPACYLELRVRGGKEGLHWNNRKRPQLVQVYTIPMKQQLLARNEKTLLSSMWMTDIRTTIQYYPRIAIWQQQAQSCLRTRKITRHPRNQSQKKGNYLLTSTSLAVVCSAHLLRWFHHKRSAGAKAPFQVKMSNFSSVTEEGTPINY